MSKQNRERVDKFFELARQQGRNGPVIVDFLRGGVIAIRDVSYKSVTTVRDINFKPNDTWASLE